MLSFLLLLLSASVFAASDRALTDEDLHRLLESQPGLSHSHGLMAGQQDRLHRILDAFLKGELETVSRISREISSDMRAIVLDQSEDLGSESETWQAMSRIIAESQRMKQKSGQGDYRPALESYQRIINECIICHQYTRQWGKLPEAKEEPEAAPAPAAPAVQTKPKSATKR